MESSISHPERELEKSDDTCDGWLTLILDTAAGKQQQGFTPMRRKALGDITNSKSASKQQQSGGGGSSQKGAKASSRAAVTPSSKLVFPSHVEEVECATRFGGEQEFTDADLDIDALLSASGPLETSAQPLSTILHSAVEFEPEQAAGEREGEEEGFVDMEFDDDCAFDAPDIGIDCDDD